VRLAVLDRSMLTVWDLTNTQAQPETYQAEAIGTPFAASLWWVSPDRIAITGSLHREMVLFSLKMKIALWSYEFDWSAIREDAGRRLREIVDSHLVYAASVDRTGPQKSLAVGAVALPGPKVDEVAATTTRESLLVQDNGWVLRPDAPNVLSAEMKLGEAKSTTYSSRLTGEEQSVTITPHVASLVLKVGTAVAWQGGTSSGVAPVIFLQKGETAQGEADKMNRPHPEFFETVDIPDNILDPAKRTGLGTTQVTNRGLIPK
jgi:hypothetical protein